MMNTTEVGQVVKHLGDDHWLWLLRKPCEGLGHVRVPSAIGCQVEDAERRLICSERLQEEMGDTSRDRTKAVGLKQDLDRLGVFSQFENRFLDLFKRAE